MRVRQSNEELERLLIDTIVHLAYKAYPDESESDSDNDSDEDFEPASNSEDGSSSCEEESDSE